MWFFRKNAQAELSERLDEGLARIVEHERRLRDIEMEWESMYGKFKALYARISRRQQREEAREEPEGGNGNRPMNPAAARLLNPYGGGS